jgi:hypothetical protein
MLVKLLAHKGLKERLGLKVKLGLQVLLDLLGQPELHQLYLVLLGHKEKPDQPDLPEGEHFHE